MAATGKQLKQSVKVFHSLMLYRRLPTNEGGEMRIKRTVKNAYLCFLSVNRLCALTLIIETVDTINRGAFMVATQQEKVLWVFNLVS